MQDAEVLDQRRLLLRLEAMGARVVLEVYDDLEHLVSDVAVASTRRLLQELLRRTPARGR